MTGFTSYDDLSHSTPTLNQKNSYDTIRSYQLIMGSATWGIGGNEAPEPRSKGYFNVAVFFLIHLILLKYILENAYTRHQENCGSCWRGGRGRGGEKAKEGRTPFLVLSSPRHQPPKPEKKKKRTKKKELPLKKPSALFYSSFSIFSFHFLITAPAPATSPTTFSPPIQPPFHHLYHLDNRCQGPLR